MTDASARRRVAIIGAGVACPLGIGLDALAESLSRGVSSITREELAPGFHVPVARTPIADDPRDGDRTWTLARACLAQVPGELSALRTVDPCRIGVAAATSKGEVLSLLGADPPPHHLAGADALARRIASGVGARGPVQARVAACATGAHNLVAAAEWISSGMADVVVCGCAEATIHPLYAASFAGLGLLTPDACRPFDARRNGFAMGEGAAVFVLASRPATERLGLAPLAWLAGWATGSDAHAMTGMNPDGAAHARLAARALADAGIVMGGVDYVQAHGTATVANDTAELAFARRACVPRLVSLKGAMGHLMGAAAGVEAAACIASIAHGVIPGTVGFEASAAPDAPVLADAEVREVRAVLQVAAGFGGQMAAMVFLAD